MSRSQSSEYQHRSGSQASPGTQAPASEEALPRLCLSAIELFIDGESFYGRMMPYEGPEAYRRLQETPDTFVYRVKSKDEEEQVLTVPLTEPLAEGVEELAVRDYQSAIARLVERQLVAGLPQLELEPTRFGLKRIRRKDDLLDLAFAKLRRERPPQLRGFHKFHRTTLRVRHEHLPSRGRVMMLTIEFSRFQEVSATVADLLQQGLDVIGMEIYRRSDEGRTWPGKIVGRRNGLLVVDSDEGELLIDGSEEWPEPSMATFYAAFLQVLGPQGYESFAKAEWAQRAKDVCGNGYVDRLQQVMGYLQRTTAVSIAPKLKVRFGGIIGLSQGRPNVDAVKMPDVEYCFSPDRTALDRFPANGLSRHGPFDGSSFDTKEPRILIVCPAEHQEVVDAFLRKLRDGTGSDGKGTFGRGIVGIYRLTRLHTRFVPVRLDGASRGVGTRYVDALREEVASRKAPDFVFVVLRDEDAFVEQDNPYLAAKAFLLRTGIPSQEVRLSNVRAPRSDLPYILRDIAVATYAKLGGTPWTIRPTMPLAKEVVIGMAHAEFGNRRSARARYMGITTVFNSEGTYLLAAGTPRCKYEDYPAALTHSVKHTLLRLAKDYGWVPGDVVRLVFHTTKPLTGTEVEMLADEAVAALGREIQVQAAYLTIEGGHPYKVLAPHEKGRKASVELLRGGRGQAVVGACAPHRGIMVDLGRSKRLLCVNGPFLMKREGEPLPHPLQISLHHRSTYRDMGALTRQVFHFTGLSWRSMLPVTEPVTIFYPHLIARLLGRFSVLPDWSDDLLDTRLQRSRWFL